MSNALDQKIKIEILPTKLVKQTELREQKVNVGFGLLDPEVNLGVSISC